MSAPRDRPIDDAVTSLLAQALPEPVDLKSISLLRGIIEECVSMVGSGIDIADFKLVAAAFSEIRQALLCFRPYAGIRKVTVFGSARTTENSPEYGLARNFSRRAADAGFMLITGAGPGIMEACQRGAGRKKSFGVNIKLPFENEANPTIAGDPKLAEFKYFFTRKLFFLKESSAIVLFPGGFGTHDESFEALTLIQTGKSQMVPVVYLDLPNGTYWKSWDRYVREHLLRRELISEQDLALYKVTDDIDVALREITSFYRVYHSARYVGRKLVVRLNHRVAEELLTELQAEFKDILSSPIDQRGPFRQEADEPELASLPRLVLGFDRQSHGRLRQLIDAVNERG
ncbi:MAG: LOG family protein [Candidatus Binatia bacterium]